MSVISEEELRAWRSLLNAHSAAIRRINRLLQEQDGLALESYDVLLELYNAPHRRLRLNELGERVVLTRSGISRLVSRLEDEGLVRRTSVEGDGRGVHAELTTAGSRAFKRTWPLYAAGIRDVFASHLTGQEATLVADILERVSSGATEA